MSVTEPFLSTSKNSPTYDAKDSPETSMSASSVLIHVDLVTKHFGVEHKIKNPFVMIIGVTTYKGKASNGWDHLPGVEKDVEMMRNLWQNELQFNTEILTDHHPNCSKHDILDFRDQCKKIVSEKNILNGKRYDGLICIVSGHGLQNKFISGDGKEIDINENFFIDFNAEHVKLLANYPKIFLFDTCRGMMPPNIKTKMINVRGRELISCNVQDGYRISYATTPGKKTFENIVKGDEFVEGGEFIKAFYDVMLHLYDNKKLHDTDFQTILRRTSQKAKIRTENALCPVHEDYTNYKIFIKCKYRQKKKKNNKEINDWSTMSLKKYIKVQTLQEEKMREDLKMLDDDDATDKLKLWLENVVKLPQYVEVFKNHDIESLSIAMELDKDTLGAMGITSIGHQLQIMRCLRELKASNENQVSQKKRKGSICSCLCRKDTDSEQSDVEDTSCVCVVL